MLVEAAKEIATSPGTATGLGGAGFITAALAYLRTHLQTGWNKEMIKELKEENKERDKTLVDLRVHMKGVDTKMENVEKTLENINDSLKKIADK